MFQWGSRDNHAFKVLCHQGLYIGIEAVHVCLGRCLVGEVAHLGQDNLDVEGTVGQHPIEFHFGIFFLWHQIQQYDANRYDAGWNAVANLQAFFLKALNAG